MSDQPRRPVFFWLVLLVCVVYAGLFAFTVYAVGRYYGVEKAPGWRAWTDGTSWFVLDVDESGPAAGRIQLGDRLLAINGDERTVWSGLFEWSFVDGGKTYRVDLERRGERVSLELPLPLVSGQRLTPIFALVGLAFFICGAALALLRPQDSQVRLAGAFLIAVGFATLHQTLQAVFGFLVGWEQIVQLGVVPLSLWALPLAYHFFSRFPAGRSPGPLWRVIQWLLYASFVLVIWPAWTDIYLARSLYNGAPQFLFPQLFTAAAYVINFGMYPYMVICFVLAMVLTARNYHRLRDRDSRRRIRWVVAGLMIAVIPFVGLIFAFNVAEWIAPDVLALLSAELPCDALHPGVDRGRGMEGAIVRYPRARPPRAPISVCSSGAPHAPRASDCVADLHDLLESQPHRRSDANSGLGLAERRLDRRHRRDALLEAAGTDLA